MAAGETVLLAAGLPDRLWALMQPRLAAALANLDLEGDFGSVRVSADDLPGDDDAWYHILPGDGDTHGTHLAITCHVDAFYRRQPLNSTVYPPRAIWEQMDAPRTEETRDLSEFSAARTDIFLHHHLLTVADLRDGSVIGENLPVRLAEAFGAAWAVAIDGRLERRHLPGYPVSERRGRFSRLFSAAGILLPEHWQIFEALWGGGLAGQKAILGAVRQLPRL